MRRPTIVASFLGVGVGTLALTWWVTHRNLTWPILRTKLVHKVVNMAILPWRMTTPENVFEIPRISDKNLAELLTKDGFTTQEPRSGVLSRSQKGPFVSYDAHDFTRDTNHGTVEIVSIMESEGVKALMIYEEIKDPVPPPQ